MSWTYESFSIFTDQDHLYIDDSKYSYPIKLDKDPSTINLIVDIIKVFVRQNLYEISVKSDVLNIMISKISGQNEYYIQFKQDKIHRIFSKLTLKELNKLGNNLNKDFRSLIKVK